MGLLMRPSPPAGGENSVLPRNDPYLMRDAPNGRNCVNGSVAAVFPANDPYRFLVAPYGRNWVNFAIR